MDLSGFKLTYDDEFNSFKSSPDGSSGYQTTFYFGGRELWSNGDWQYYSDSSVGVNPFSLANGTLNITAAPAAPGSNPDNQSYTSGLITTEGMFAQTYGYFEIRMEVAAGAGMWTGFWMLPVDKSWPPEIDIVEAFGAPNAGGEGGPNSVWHNEISTNRNNDRGWFVPVNGSTTGYHTYGVDWEADYITWYVDGVMTRQTATPSDFNKPMYMIANLAVGGWAGATDGQTGVTSIDYIRAYSHNPSAQAVSLQTISSPDGADTKPYGATDSHGVITNNPPPPPPPPSNLIIHVSEDAWNGNAQFTVKVDGVQIGGTQTATALHSAGQWQDIVLTGSFTTGPHDIDVTFINDAWGGTPTTDRNLYVQSVTINGHTLDWHTAENGASNGMRIADAGLLAVNGTIRFSDPGSGTTNTTTTAHISTLNAGDALTVRVSEDAWHGDAQFVVTVDGVQVGGVQTATGSHADGAWQDIAIAGVMPTSPTAVAVHFINDDWGGTSATDRNLYVQSITVNGETMSYTAAHNDAANGMVATDSAILATNGTLEFDINHSAPPAILG